MLNFSSNQSISSIHTDTSVNIRTAVPSDLEEIASLEALCFPAAEAASLESFRWRIATYPDHFLLLTVNGRIVSFINGPVTAEPDLMDEMYDSPSFSDEDCQWQMIFGLVTHPRWQRHGYAAIVMKAFIGQARSQRRKGVVLTCKEHMIHYYEKFGFRDEGISSSVHGGVPWHQMRLSF